MRYVQINMTCEAWADSIVFRKHRELIANGDESWVFWGRGEHEQDEHMQRINTDLEVDIDGILTRLDGRPGFHSKAPTRRLLAKLDAIDPDVVHLHVLTGYYINVEMLFEWLAAHSCKLVWTLHDCWDFTGHCIYFTYAKCMQWRSACAASTSCPQKREYPECWFSGNRTVLRNFEEKKRLFTMLPPERVQLITPSQWLAELVKQSFLGKYDVKVLHNTINTDVFKPTPSKFRERCDLGDRFVVLGVASKWSERKGLKDFVRLAQDLDPERFAVVVVGLSDEQVKEVGREAKDIVALPKTKTRQELVEAYSVADVFFNPTVEDNYPTVNLEAEACGTPVVTYDTGGCRETVHSSKSQVVRGYEEAVHTIETIESGDYCS